MKSSDLDPVLVAPSRLAILLTLAPGDAWSFTSLRDETGLADGNLHVQAQRLEEAGYLRREAAADGGRRVTLFRLTGAGRRAIERHLRVLRHNLEDDSRDEAAPRRRHGELGRRSDASRVW